VEGIGEEFDHKKILKALQKVKYNFPKSVRLTLILKLVKASGTLKKNKDNNDELII